MALKELKKQSIYTPNIKFLDNEKISSDFDFAIIPDLNVELLKGVLVTPISLIFVKGKSVSITVNFDKEIKAIPFYKKIINFIRYRFLGKIIFHNNEYYLFAYDSWSTNYYHWLCEVLPRLLMMKNEYKDGIVVIPKSFSNYTFIIDTLNLLELKYLMIDTNYSSYFNHLVTVNTKPVCGNVDPAVLSNMVSNIYGKLNIPIIPPKRKIYISRAKANYRKIINEAEILPHLIEQGYEIIYAEELSFKEQVKLFSETHSLIAMHGGGLTNIIFMPPHSKIIEIRSGNWDTNPLCYWRLANVLQIEWNYFEASIIGGETNFDDIVLDVRLFLKSLKTFS